MSATNMKFGQRLKELRTAAGMTQGDLAEKVNVTVRSISRLETGVQEATWPVVLALCAALGVKCDAFDQAPSVDAEPQGRGRPAKPQQPAAEEKPAKRKARARPQE